MFERHVDMVGDEEYSGAMFDIGMGEMVLLAVIMLVALGPKQLPEVARALGKALGDLKRTANDFTGGFMDIRDSANKYIEKTQTELNHQLNAKLDLPADLKTGLMNPSGGSLAQTSTTTDPSKTKDPSADQLELSIPSDEDVQPAYVPYEGGGGIAETVPEPESKEDLVRKGNS